MESKKKTKQSLSKTLIISMGTIIVGSVGVLIFSARSNQTNQVTLPQEDTSKISAPQNKVSQFTDWSGSDGVDGPLSQPSKDYSSQSGLDTTTIPGSITIP